LISKRTLIEEAYFRPGNSAAGESSGLAGDLILPAKGSQLLEAVILINWREGGTACFATSCLISVGEFPFSKAAVFCIRGIPGNGKNATELASSNPYRCVMRERLLWPVADI
jgi:hypothetical protein